jgi:hypothetical protein
MILVQTYIIVEGRCYAIGLFLRKRARTELSNKVELPKVYRVDIDKELSAVNVTSFLEKVIFIEFEQDRSFVCLQNNFEFKQ